MDKVYRYKLIKLAIAIPLAFSVALVLDIQASLSFFGPLFVFVVILLFPDPIELKRFIVKKMLLVMAVASILAAFIASFSYINSVIVFLFILLTGWGIKNWIPVAVNLGLTPIGIFTAMAVLRSSSPYTTLVYMLVLISVGVAFGLFVDSFFWPVYSSQIVEKQVSQLFGTLEILSQDALGFEEDDSKINSQNLQIEKQIKGINKALKIAVMTNSLSVTEQQKWEQLIILQKKTFLHLQELRKLIHTNKNNFLLNRIKPDIYPLNDTLSETLLTLANVTLNPTSNLLLPNPNINLQRWKNHLNKMRENGETQSFDLISRLNVALIEYSLEGLVKTISESITLVEESSTQVIINQSLNTLKFQQINNK
ncbi:hypothetical protein [Crocosphaera sp.]|uniref:hypothetical protein n=1 Tax=Crocosphaera sp. TaxID=2729996 RepID=UPI002634D556|nr:hypothetical protein [Crocosphaera sp.]MDJ0579439.1 hypothetical protein [Crocosphaera sp.]